MSAASRCKRLDPSIEIVVFEQTGDVSYSACGMPYNIADPARELGDLVVRSADAFREKQGIDLRLGHTVDEIDRRTKKVVGHSAQGDRFEVQYDKLLIATGARAIVPDAAGMDLPVVMTLKSLGDARRIKDFLAAGYVKNVLIVGMGYIGLEMAEAFHARGAHVEMVDALPRLLPWMPEEMAGVVGNELDAHGVKLHFNAGLAKIERHGSTLTTTLSNGDSIASDMALIAIGVRPNSELAAAAGLELGPKRSIAVDKRLSTSDPDILAAGDCADAFNVVTGERVWIPLALRANRAGWAAADHAAGKPVELPGVVGTGVFKVFGLEVARTGLSLDEARTAGFDAVENSIKSRSRAHAHPGNRTIHVSMVGDRAGGRLLGAQMVGAEGAAHRIDAVSVALHAGMRVSDFAQCDMAYAPPFSPVWDPLLTAAIQLERKL
jgi:NADPH-dependent 2,4-dienoyl-CoA reductase/sulfur reductase-like enzyme